MAALICTTCDQRFDSLPDDAVQITPGRRRINSYRFADGAVHHLRLDASRGNFAKGLHTRWHKTPRPECIYCYPPVEEAPPELPVEQTELLTEVVSVLAELPEPPPEPVVAVVPVAQPTTAIAHAFRKLFK